MATDVAVLAEWPMSRSDVADQLKIGNAAIIDGSCSP
jgi:hypothetical protein